MLLLRGLLGFALLALWIYCVVDVITRDESECRNLPKLVWLVIVVFLPGIGSLLWLIAGRPRGPEPAPSGLNGRLPGRRPATNPDDDEVFLQGLRDRAEQQRRAANQQRREAERRAAEEDERRKRDE
jgi:hypothetical protein